MDKLRDRVEKAITLSYMRTANRFPIVAKYQSQIVSSYIDLLTMRREKSWRERSLPDFIIIGGMKCGSSSLYKYLKQHPQLYSSHYKEVRYFSHDANYARGEKWYRTHFPRSDSVPEGALVFEASPDYMHYVKAPVRMAKLLPDIKLIALLRNPTERAISHYFHDIKKGRKIGDILPAMQAEHGRYRSRSVYKDPIGLYYKIYKPENILIIDSAKLFERTGETLRQVYRFLGIHADCDIKNLSPKQVGYNRAPVEREVYDYLNAYYRPFNRELFDLIGQKFDW